MEAIGLVASIITLIGAATLTGSSLTRLWGLWGTPFYIVTALNEVNDFTATLTLLKSVLNMGDVPDEVLTELARLLQRAADQLDSFDRYLGNEVLRDKYWTSDRNQPRLRRRAKWREVIGEAQQQIDGLQQGLLSIKVNIGLALNVAQLWVTFSRSQPF